MIAEKNYLHYLSVLKCLGMFAVIGIHAFCTPFSYYSDFYSPLETFLSYFITNALRAWAVPIFVMVSGSLFLDTAREITLKKLYTKYIFRLLLTLITFGALFALMERVFNTRTISLQTLFLSVGDVYQGHLWDHLWFMYMIIGLYAVTPPLKVFVSNADEKTIRYILLVLFIFNCFIPFFNELTNTVAGFYIPVNSIWLFYYLLGYAIRFEIIKISDRFCVLCIFCGLLWCFAGQFLPNMTSVNGAHLKYAGTSDFIAVLMSVGIFSLAKSKCKAKINFVDTFINPLSFGVYILHALFINFILKVIRFTPEYHSVLLVWAVLLIITIIGSLISVWILRKIPFIRKAIS